MNDQNKIWVVFNPQGRAPFHVHDSEQSAKTEARRLARVNPEYKFHVMESIGYAVRQEVAFYASPLPSDKGWPDYREMHDDIPF